MTTTVEGVKGQRHAQAALYPRKLAGTRCTGGLIRPQDQSGQVRIISPPPGFDHRTVQPADIRCAH